MQTSSLSTALAAALGMACFSAASVNAASPSASGDAPLVVAQVTDQLPDVLPGAGDEPKQKRRGDPSARDGKQKGGERTDEEKARRKEERAKRDDNRQNSDEGPPRAESGKQKRDADRARADADKQKGDAERARADAEKQKREDDRARAEAEKQRREEDRARSYGDKQKQEADRARADAEKQKRDAERARAEAEKAKRDEDRGRAEADDKDRKAQTDPRGLKAPGGLFSPQARPGTRDERRGGADDAERENRGADDEKTRDDLRKLKGQADDEFRKAQEEQKKQRDRAARFRTDKRDVKRERKAEEFERKFESLRGQRKERVESGGRIEIDEPDKRTIVKDGGRAFIRHDETERFRKGARNARVEKRRDGNTANIIVRPGGIEIISIINGEGRLVKRSRRGRDGREVVLIDNSSFYARGPRRPWWRPGQRRSGFDVVVDLPRPVIRIPRNKYVVDYEESSRDDVYEALSAPPVERLERGYSLEEVRRSYSLRERMRRVDLDAINFEFGSWEVENDQYPKLEWVADALKRVLRRNPDEVFLIEGHTDAVGSDVDNLSLSDRRAESVAVILTDVFEVPPENLVTQGYGEEFLKIDTSYPERQNRRVAVRRVTPLLSSYDDRGRNDDRSDNDGYEDDDRDRDGDRSRYSR